MKISKLFHWLYASVMLLPLFAIGVTCLYTIFNKNAKDSYYGVNINQSDIVTLASNNEIKSNQLYTYNSSLLLDTTFSGSLYADFTYVVSYNTLTTEQIDFINSSVRLYSYRGTSSTFYKSDNSSLVVVGYVEVLVDNISYYNGSVYSALTYIEYNKDSYLDNSFYYSTRLLKESNYFNWAKDSFLAQPITYITNLFGMDNDNIVIYLLSYWLDISIIWLTFDLVMYVPLLVHRWLDKGVLE